MSGTVRINATAVSHTGKGRVTSEGSFYMNGRYTYKGISGDIQVSVENSLNEYIFAVYDGLEKEKAEKNTYVSITEELRKYQEKTRSALKDINIRIDEVIGCADEVDNLIHSMDVGSGGELQRQVFFQGLVISGDKAATISSGGCKVYCIKGDKIKKISQESKKTEKLVKLGILEEEAHAASDYAAGNHHEPGLKLKRSELLELENGDIFILCNKELSNRLTEIKLNEIVKHGSGSDYLASSLVSEALKSGEGENLTAVVIKVYKAGSEVAYDYIKPLVNRSNESLASRIAQKMPDSSGAGPVQPTDHMRHFNKLSNGSRRKRKAIQSFVSTVMILAILGGLVFATFKWIISSAGSPELEANAGAVTTPAIDPTDETPGTEPNEDSLGDNANDPDEEDIQQSPQPSVTPSPTDGSAASSDNMDLLATHKVQPGDTLGKISQKYYNDRNKIDLIMKANNMTDPNKIREGQELKIPKP